ncbi:unnamed protein product [Rotaria magnacalcarata]|uniref:Uncharacterized protein n=1 Tax=Rotaria magnacalcarata TaxID=392030 RepID=A0A819G8P7_9BILA|nr:unnamed protein product [Rotaria magnacalcarata]CAF1627181.1 unnamed protein product [Rotaria magnacalcarata]CAF2060955.1 unnamed protein product [Rotaria magnacalcarata]CAF2151405.1 unnamed protein product [Rotaria magnacalcarata]CAF3797351.1 unnamed protein product [Rotaria magnacalcarata]
MSHLSNYELCEIKEISPFYRLFNQYKNQELMFTVTFFILLMYLEEFLFAFQYLLVRMGYARPFIIQMTIFETKDQISPIDSDSNTEDS